GGWNKRKETSVSTAMAMFKFMRNRRNSENDDDTSASDDAPMPRSNGGSNHRRGRGGGGGGHLKQRPALERQGRRGPSIDQSTSNQPLLRRANSGGGINVDVDKAYHRGGNMSFLSDTCSETDGNETLSTAKGDDGSPYSSSGEWVEDGCGEASPSPPPPPPSRRGGGGAPSRANIAGADSSRQRQRGGEFTDKNGQGRGIARSNSQSDVSPSPQNTPKNHPSARGSARVLPPPPSLIKDADNGDGGDEKSMKIKPPSIKGMPRTRKSKSLTRSDPTLMTSSPSSSKSWGPDGGGDGVRVAAAPIAEGEALQRLALLVVSLRADLREANAARKELEARLFLEEESRKRQPTNDDDDSARLRLKDENAMLRADVDVLFAEQDDLRGEVAELREEKKMLNDVIARLKREGGGGGDASLGGGSRGSIVSYKKTTTSSTQDLENRILDLADENHKLESELQLLVREKSELINSRSLEAEELRKSLMEQESQNAEVSAQKDRTIKEMQEKIDLLREECNGLEKVVAESKMKVAVLEDELERQDEQVEENKAKSKEELELLKIKLAQAENDVKMMQERSLVADRVLLEQKRTVEELLKERHVRQELDDIKEYEKAGNLLHLEKKVGLQEKSKRVLHEELTSKNITDPETTLHSKRDHPDITASLQQRTVELEMELNEANSAISMLEDDLDRKDAQVKELLNKLTILHQNLSRAEQSNAALSRKNHELVSKNDDIETSIKIMTIENKAAKEEIEMYMSMKNIEDDDSVKDNLHQEVKQLLEQLEELRNKSSYKKMMALEEEVYQLQEDKKKILHDLDESSDAIMTLGDALKELEDTLAVRDSEIRKLKGSLDEKEMSLKGIMSSKKEHQYECQSSADTIATLKMKIASLETKSSDLEKELNITIQAFLDLKNEKNDESAVITDLQIKLTKATEENGTLIKRISLLITANEQMKEEVKELGESLATCLGNRAGFVAAKAALSSPSSGVTFPSCALSSDPLTSCESLISELRNKINEIVSSRNAALREVAILRSDTSVTTLKAIEHPSGPSTVNPTAEQNKSSSANTNNTSTIPSQQDRASVIKALNESISSDKEDDERSTKSCEKTTAYSRSPSNSGSRGSSLLEAAKKLCSKLEEKKMKEESNKAVNRTISVSALSTDPKGADSEVVTPSTDEQVNHILEQDDEEISAKEIKEDSPMETTGMSDVKARPPLPPPEQDTKTVSKPKIDIDQLTSIYFEKGKGGTSMSKFSDVSWSSNSSRPKHPNDSVVKKVKICRNGVFMGTYEGELNAEGQRHGIGVLLCDNGNSYEGEWKKDKRDGLGVARYSSGDVYDGQWERGRRHGRGIMYIEAGDTYDGQWKNGLKHGAGTYHWVDGEVDVSWYQEDKRVGEGVRWTTDRKKAFRLVRGTKKEELSLDEAYATAERLGLSLAKFEL
ncbi:hypothetical protein ACHAXA_011606, partial [Cyclostephanos tholiformis]